MIAVEAHFAAYTVAFFDHIGSVLPERASHPVYITSELVMADELRPERAPEGEAFVKDFRDQTLVGVVPYVFVECANNLLLR